MPDDQNQTANQVQTQAQVAQVPEPEQAAPSQPDAAAGATEVQEVQPSDSPIVMDIGPTEESTYVAADGDQVSGAVSQSAQQAPKEAKSESKITLDQLIALCIEKEASDIHFGEDAPVALRVRGNLVFIENISTLSGENAREMIYSMVPTKEEQRRLEHLREIDFSYTHRSGVNFRVNLFYQRGRLSAVMRMISKNLPQLDQLGVPQAIKRRLSYRKGLIVVAGASGSGKSTTVQAMLEYINQSFVKHIITIENPIEYVFSNKRSIFSQREVGKDTLAVSNAIHSALKEDPNVIMVSEITDVEMFDSVLNAVEAGYLVITTMPTKDIRQTLERMFFMHPQSEQKHVQERISNALIAIVAQDLVNRSDRPGRVAVFELMLANSGIQSIIKNGSLGQLRAAIQSGHQEGMVTIDAYAYHLGEQGIIAQETVEQFMEQE